MAADYSPIYQWESEKLLEKPGVNPYYTYNFPHMKNGESKTLFRKAEYGYPFYPPVDSQFIRARLLALDEAKLIANGFFLFVYVMTPKRLQHMQDLTERFLYTQHFGQLVPEQQNTVSHRPT